MKYTTKKFDDLTVHELYAIIQLRIKIFAVEQNCVYQDLDDVDQKSWHLFGVENGKILSYTRLLPPNVNYPEPSIGRVVLDPSLRGRNLGKELMRVSIEKCEELFKTKKITISAQCYLQRFYNELGFKEEGEPYEEDHIPHIKMKI
jgi:ElaA protein